MKAAFTLFGLVASTIAGNVVRGGQYDHDDDKGHPVVTYGPPAYVATTKTVDVYYVCEPNSRPGTLGPYSQPMADQGAPGDGNDHIPRQDHHDNVHDNEHHIHSGFDDHLPDRQGPRCCR